MDNSFLQNSQIEQCVRWLVKNYTENLCDEVEFSLHIWPLQREAIKYAHYMTFRLT